MLELKFRQDRAFPGVRYAELRLRDVEREGGHKRVIVASIVKEDHPTLPWKVWVMPPPNRLEGAGFDRGTYACRTLAEAKSEIAAILFVAIVGKRSGHPIHRIRTSEEPVYVADMEVCEKARRKWRGSQAAASDSDVPVIQDGAQFYHDETGELLYSSERRVKDFDAEAAEKARHEFEAYASANGWRVVWH